MEDIRFKHFSPIVTGTPGAGQGLYPPSTSTQTSEPSVAFADVLKNTIEKNMYLCCNCRIIKYKQ